MNTDLQPRSPPNHTLKCGSARKRSARTSAIRRCCWSMHALRAFRGTRGADRSRCRAHPGRPESFLQTNLAGDGTMLAPEILRERFDSLLKGRQPSQTVMYCGSGVTACHNLLAMEHAGRGADFYPGLVRMVGRPVPPD